MTRTLLAAALAALLAAAAAADDRLIVHEWGSLILVQGSDGVILGGLRDDLSELPPFVLRWSSVPMRAESKVVRKPILYVYSKRKRTLDIMARVPGGIWTEWWPPAQDFGPRKAHAMSKVLARKGYAHWKRVEVHPTAPAAPAARAATGWYPLLRQTDAAWLRVQGRHFATAGKWQGTKFDELERFLLYRGVSNTRETVELRVSSAGGKLSLSHRGKTAIGGRVLLVEIADGKGWMHWADAPAPGASVVVDRARQTAVPVAQLEKDGIAAVTDWTTRAGLYRKEATGMSSIWGREWFRRTGLRALYLVPRSKIDELMPLTIKPAPDETVRVLVAAIEAMTPRREAEIRKWVDQLAARTWADRQAAMLALKKLGYMAEPVLRAALREAKDPETAGRIKRLLRLLEPLRRDEGK